MQPDDAAPPAEQFQTMNEIAEYRSGASIECLICGKHFQALAHHISRIHDIDPHDYRRRFGIPATYGLTSERSRLKSSQSALNNPKGLEALKRYREEFGHPPAATGPIRPLVPATIKLMTENNRNGWVGVPDVTVPCRVCGGAVVVRERNASRPARCLNCSSHTARKARIGYYRNKWRSRKARLTAEELSGYKTPFQTKEEVDAYLSGETIDCLICGERLQRLNMHLKRDHAMTPDEYRVKFGIPFSRPLSSPAARHTQKITVPETNIASFTAMVRTQKIDPEKRRHKRVSPAPYAIELRRESGKALAARVSQRVVVACRKCGGDFETTVGHASRRPPCFNCASKATQNSRLRRMALKAEGPQPPPAHYDVPFQTMEQVDDYFSGEKIQCLVCGERMRSLPKHLRDKHAMQPVDYRIQFGIPHQRGLQSAGCTARKSAAMTPESIERIRREGRKRVAAGAKTTPSVKPLVGAVLDQRTKRLFGARRAARVRVPVPCVECGVTVEALRLHATRKVYCIDCSPNRSSRLRRARKKLEAEQAARIIPETPALDAHDSSLPIAGSVPHEAEVDSGCRISPGPAFASPLPEGPGPVAV